jgi:hypothetical protein
MREGARNGIHLERKIDQLGTIRIDLKRCWIGNRFIDQWVIATIDAPSRNLQMYHEHHLLKTLPLKGLRGKRLSFEAFVSPMQQQARASQRLRSLQDRQRRMSAWISPSSLNA